SGEPAAPGPSGDAAPPRPEKLAEPAGIEPKPAPAPKTSLASEAPQPAAPVPEAPASQPERSPQKNLAASEPPAATKAGDSVAAVDAKRDSGGLRLTFSFAAATPAALFPLADTVWLGFESTTPI